MRAAAALPLAMAGLLWCTVLTGALLVSTLIRAGLWRHRLSRLLVLRLCQRLKLRFVQPFLWRRRQRLALGVRPPLPLRHRGRPLELLALAFRIWPGLLCEVCFLL